jgi:hypothetical protein
MSPVMTSRQLFEKEKRKIKNTNAKEMPKSLNEGISEAELQVTHNNATQWLSTKQEI